MINLSKRKDSLLIKLLDEFGSDIIVSGSLALSLQGFYDSSNYNRPIGDLDLVIFKKDRDKVLAFMKKIADEIISEYAYDMNNDLPEHRQYELLGIKICVFVKDDYSDDTFVNVTHVFLDGVVRHFRATSISDIVFWKKKYISNYLVSKNLVNQRECDRFLDDMNVTSEFVNKLSSALYRLHPFSFAGMFIDVMQLPTSILKHLTDLVRYWKVLVK